MILCGIVDTIVNIYIYIYNPIVKLPYNNKLFLLIKSYKTAFSANTRLVVLQF